MCLGKALDVPDGRATAPTSVSSRDAVAPLVAGRGAGAIVPNWIAVRNSVRSAGTAGPVGICSWQVIGNEPHMR